MSKIDDIDVTRPLEFYGSKKTLGKGDVFDVDECGHMKELSPEDALQLLEYVKTSGWRENFEGGLRRVSNTSAGEDVLVVDITMDAFCAFVNEISQPGCSVQNVSLNLEQTTRVWSDFGPDTVTLVGYCWSP